jgi:3-oxoacyl-[acyl-carrier-protein] synthase-3
MRCARTPESAVVAVDESGNLRSRDNLFMNGGEIFAFTLRTVPAAVNALLAKSGHTKDDVDLFIFHQANRYMLETLRKQMKIPQERFFLYLEDCGNTVSNTLPIALKAAMEQNLVRPGSLVMLVGFGVGYSWGATMVRWV